MAPQVVSFLCVLKNSLGHIISSTFNHDVLTRGQDNEFTLKPVVEALQNLKKGDKKRISLRADEAYGFYLPDLVVERSLEDLSLDGPLKMGDRVNFVSNGKTGAYRVIEISEHSVTLDGNHPLAGQDLVFEIEAINSRLATAEDLGEVVSIDRSKALFH